MITTHHCDNLRSGSYPEEPDLNTTNVKSAAFGKVLSREVVGSIYAQPLYVPGVVTPTGPRNLIFIATMHNHVYAFDATDSSATDPVWGPTSLGASVALPAIDIGWGIGYKDIVWELGVLSTPTIDATKSALYVVAMISAARYVYKLFKIDIRNGAIVNQTDISTSASGTGDGNVGGTIAFITNRQNQRPGLLLANDRIYIGFAGFGDTPPYHGWVLAYDATTLKLVATFNTTPNGAGGGVWQAGQGLASDSSGNIYFMTGNGSFDGASDYGNSVIKLDPNLKLLDSFTPFDVVALNQGSNGHPSDRDLGSSGLLLIPGTKLALGGGKAGKLYLLSRDDLGEFSPGHDRVIQSFVVEDDHHIHGGPTFVDLGTGGQVYVWPEDTNLKCFKFQDGLFNPTPVMQSADPGPAGMPGGFLTISHNNASAGTAVLWASHPAYNGDASANQKVVSGTLHAFDAADLGTELWNSDRNILRDGVGNFAKFCPPTVAAGRVYMPSMGGIYGKSKVTLSESSLRGPAICAVGNSFIALSWTGLDTNHSLNVMTSADGRGFQNKVTLPDRSFCEPALASDGATLFLAWTDQTSENYLNVTSTTDGSNFENKIRLEERAGSGPALAWHRGRLFVVWEGKDNARSINIMSSTDGINWGNKLTLPEYTSTSPAITSWNGKLYLCWIENDGTRRIGILASDDGATWVDKRALGDRSLFHCALLGTANILNLTWIGDETAARLNMRSSWRSHDLDFKATYEEPGVDGPSMTLWRGRPLISWTGGDSKRRINVAQVSSGSVEVYGLSG